MSKQTQKPLSTDWFIRIVSAIGTCFVEEEDFTKRQVRDSIVDLLGRRNVDVLGMQFFPKKKFERIESLLELAYSNAYVFYVITREEAQILLNEARELSELLAGLNAKTDIPWNERHLRLRQGRIAALREFEEVPSRFVDEASNEDFARSSAFA